MPRVTKNTLGKFARSNRRKRTGVVTRAKYQKPTARNQKKQILGNALAIRAIKRIMPKPIYTDWQYSGQLKAIAPDDSFSETLASVQLMSPANGATPSVAFWQPVLRQDVNVIESSATRVLRMQMNLRYSLRGSDWAQFSLFIVTIRPDAVDTVPNAANLVKGQDYITNIGDDFNVRLNPAVFKVHYARNVSLMKNNWTAPAAVVGGVPFAGNPRTTYTKGQVNMKLGFTLKQPRAGLSWTIMNQSQLGPSQRYFLLAFIVQRQPNPDGLDDVAIVNFDNLYTCYNAA